MTASHLLRLTIDRLEASAETSAAGAVIARACFVAEGMAMFRAGDNAATLSANSAFLATGPIDATAGKDGAVRLRYELGPVGTAKPDGVMLEAGLTLDDPDGYLMRCDKVELPPGGIAYTHTHRGGGIRCLVEGSFNVKVDGKTTVISPLEAWFESGPDPVYAWAPDDKPGHFSRVMILPRWLKEKSSIRYMKPEDAEKPKLQKYTIFLDEFIET